MHISLLRSSGYGESMLWKACTWVCRPSELRSILYLTLQPDRTMLSLRASSHNVCCSFLSDALGFVGWDGQFARCHGNLHQLWMYCLFHQCYVRLGYSFWLLSLISFASLQSECRWLIWCQWYDAYWISFVKGKACWQGYSLFFISCSLSWQLGWYLRVLVGNYVWPPTKNAGTAMCCYPIYGRFACSLIMHFVVWYLIHTTSLCGASSLHFTTSLHRHCVSFQLCSRMLPSIPFARSGWGWLISNFHDEAFTSFLVLVHE